MAAGPSLSEVPGWLLPADALLFEWILRWQSRTGVRADVLELGVYRGRTAIHIGEFVAADERFVVCDLFEDTQHSDAVPGYVKSAYSTLTQASFESNYLKFHPTLPAIVRGPTSTITDHVPPDSCRFVHIDASHLYADVRADTVAARSLLRHDGVVVFDDYRNKKTAGTAAAVWEAVAVDGLVPICVSDARLYGTWGDPEPLRQEITTRLERHPSFHPEQLTIRDRPVIRVAPTALPAAAYARPADSAAETHSTTARVLDAIGRKLSSSGYRVSRLARADDPVSTARQAAGRRTSVLRSRISDSLRRFVDVVRR